MNLDFNEKTKKIIATTLSILGIILIVIGFSIPNNNSISSNKPYQYAGNKDLEKSKKDKDSEIIVDNTEEKVDTSDEEKEENIIDEENKNEENQIDDFKDETIEKEEDSTKQEEITNIKNTLTIYKNENGYCKLKSDTCNTIAYTIIVDSNDAKILEFSEDNNYMLYKDNTLKIYDTLRKETKKINLTDTNEETYKFVLNKDKVIGLIYKDKDTELMGYYDINNSLKMYENKYQTITKTDYDDYLIGTFLEDDKVNYALLKINEEQVEIADKTTSTCELNFKIYTNNNQSLFIEKSTCPDEGIKNIYSNSKKILASNLINNDYYSIYDGNIFVNDNNIIKKYDFEGNIIDSKKIGEFKQLIRNNVIYVENDSLFLYDMNTKENIKFGEWNSNNIYIGSDSTKLYSGYKTSKNLDAINKVIDDKVIDEGIYLIINYKNKDNEGNLGIIYFYNRDIGVRIYNIKNN